MAAVAVSDVAAERSDFDCRGFGIRCQGDVTSYVSTIRLRRSSLSGISVYGDQNHAKLGADTVATGENTHHLVGSGIGCDVVIGGFTAEHQVAHAPADQVGLMPGLAELLDNRVGAGSRHGPQSRAPVRPETRRLIV